jgi:alkyldihydroxyacetonephosphate synthase
MERRDVWERVKWNGWGEKGVYYGINNKGNVEHSRTGVELPKIIPFAKEIMGIEELEHTPSIELEDIQIPEPRENAGFIKSLNTFLSPSQISFDKEQRICHTYGCSFRDLWRLRKGIISDPPDCVIYPQSHEDVERIVIVANTHKVCLVPCGGRTNIVGAVETQSIENRFVASLDLRRMNRLLWVDKKTMTACFEVGILGPDIENSLKKEGLSLGHDPDSFEWSTLGGWLATCSSGMQSDKYGDIEDMCVSLKVVTPGAGTIVTPAVPRNGSGPSLKHFFCGYRGHSRNYHTGDHDCAQNSSSQRISWRSFPLL